jgi:hypothetical protein
VTQISMNSRPSRDPESKLSIKQKLQIEENKVALVTKTTIENLSKPIPLQGHRESHCSS